MPLDTLRSHAAELGIELTSDQLTQMDRFAELIVETNKHFNLTRITEPEDMVASHFLDSLTCLVAAPVKDGAKAIDIGSGPGFPGLPIKITRPDVDMTLVDATRKKTDFIADSIQALGLTDARSINARAEEMGHTPEHRESYDIAYARALSEMRIVAELCLPLVKVGGLLVAQKSVDIEEELTAARPMIGQLGGQVEDIRRITIPGTEITRVLVVIAKTKPTLPGYPRAYSRIVSKGKRK